MEVNAELLAGAAITVFLALLFFGVVVLWDVALALRSVGDKIDKLEDNIDDDLTDIGHSLDNISSAPGGGTQLHLNGGGTISSGPAAGPRPSGPQQSTQHAQGTGDAGGARAAAPGPETGPGEAAVGAAAGPVAGPNPAPGAAEAGPDAGTAGAEATDAAAEREAAESTADPAAAKATVDEAPADADDATAASETPDDESDGDDGVEPETDAPGPRAERNRGRFVTSPDRTAWYAVRLDREAVRDDGPSIAGELTDGSESDVDEAEVIAAGPVESAATDEATASASTDDASDEPADAPADESDESAPAGDADVDDADASETEPERDEDEAATDEGDDTTDADGSFTFDETEAESDDDPSDTSRETAGQTETGDAADDAGGSPAASETDLEPAGEPAGEAPDTTDPDTEPDRDGDADAGLDEVEPLGAAGDDPLAGDVTAFEFDEDLDDDVSVSEAVDAINEEAPAPELSSHRFDVSAERYGSDEPDADGAVEGEGDGDDGSTGTESAVLTVEFETDTVEISGSTKRLLQYQLRSFADRDETPAADVTIGRDRIVIEIADADGNAVQRWSEAAVDVIDRTLYLSDNSSDDR